MGPCQLPMPVLLEHLSWSYNRMKYFGVFIGDAETQAKNWEGLAEALERKLLKWKGLLAVLSYRGRVLVINNLAASPLWYRIKAIPPPDVFW